MIPSTIPELREFAATELREAANLFAERVEASEAALRLAKAMEAQGVEHVFGDRCGR